MIKELCKGLKEIKYFLLFSWFSRVYDFFQNSENEGGYFENTRQTEKNVFSIARSEYFSYDALKKGRLIFV